jgi:hypothetical protein
LIRALHFALAHVLVGKPASTLPEHALASDKKTARLAPGGQ